MRNVEREEQGLDFVCALGDREGEGKEDTT